MDRSSVLNALKKDKVRFLRLQFTEENTYYVEHPDRVLGAFRASLADSTLRIDHTQHALSSLLKAERYLLETSVGAKAWGGEDLAPRTDARETRRDSDTLCHGITTGAAADH